MELNANLAPYMCPLCVVRQMDPLLEFAERPVLEPRKVAGTCERSFEVGRELIEGNWLFYLVAIRLDGKGDGWHWPENTRFLLNGAELRADPSLPILLPVHEGPNRISLLPADSAAGPGHVWTLLCGKRKSRREFVARVLERSRPSFEKSYRSFVDKLEQLKPQLPYMMNLRDPAEIKTPVCGIHCKHVECFDLERYAEENERDGRWRCPYCSQRCCDLVVCTYFEELLLLLERQMVTANKIDVVSCGWFAVNDKYMVGYSDGRLKMSPPEHPIKSFFLLDSSELPQHQAVPARPKQPLFKLQQEARETQQQQQNKPLFQLTKVPPENREIERTNKQKFHIFAIRKKIDVPPPARPNTFPANSCVFNQNSRAMVGSPLMREVLAANSQLIPWLSCPNIRAQPPYRPEYFQTPPQQNRYPYVPAMMQPRPGGFPVSRAMYPFAPPTACAKLPELSQFLRPLLPVMSEPEATPRSQEPAVKSQQSQEMRPHPIFECRHLSQDEGCVEKARVKREFETLCVQIEEISRELVTNHRTDSLPRKEHWKGKRKDKTVDKDPADVLADWPSFDDFCTKQLGGQGRRRHHKKCFKRKKRNSPSPSRDSIAELPEEDGEVPAEICESFVQSLRLDQEPGAAPKSWLATPGGKHGRKEGYAAKFYLHHEQPRRIFQVAPHAAHCDCKEEKLQAPMELGGGLDRSNNQPEQHNHT